MPSMVAGSGAVPAGRALRAATVAGMVRALRERRSRRQRPRAVEQLRASRGAHDAAAACQARICGRLRRVQRAEQAAAACRSDSRAGRRGQIALARASRPRPRRSATSTWPRCWSRDDAAHPAGHGARRQLSEWRATRHRSRDGLPRAAHRGRHRRRAQRGHRRVEGLGDKRLVTRGAIASPTRSTTRVTRSTGRGLAANERRVTIRPAPDTMCYLHGPAPSRPGRRGVRRADPRRRRRRAQPAIRAARARSWPTRWWSG